MPSTDCTCIRHFRPLDEGGGWEVDVPDPYCPLHRVEVPETP